MTNLAHWIEPDFKRGAEIGLPANDTKAGLATILVVEDEELILAGIADFLRDCGFNILEATSTKQAERVLASTAAIDVMFSDICLPDGSGFELARWCQQTRPDVRILLTSGFYKVPADIGRFSILPKPYTFRELMARLESLLPPRTQAPSDRRACGRVVALQRRPVQGCKA